MLLSVLLGKGFSSAKQGKWFRKWIAREVVIMRETHQQIIGGEQIE